MEGSVSTVCFALSLPLLQTAILVCQSIVLGLLTDFFSIEEPTAEDMRNAYLYALGNDDIIDHVGAIDVTRFTAIILAIPTTLLVPRVQQ